MERREKQVFWWPKLVIAALIVYIAQIAAILWMERRRQSHSAAWILVVMVSPYLGFAAYWLLGRRWRSAKSNGASVYRSAPVILAGAGDMELLEDGRQWSDSSRLALNRFQSFASRHLPFEETNHNRATVLRDGEETFRAILDSMQDAEISIYLDYYTIRADGIGNRFLEMLTSKARAGVEVRLLYDGIGSVSITQLFLEELHRSGAHTACFSPPGESLLKKRLNFRNHRKIVVVDGCIGFMGGVNIGDEYLGLDPRLGFWRDTHLKLEGDCVIQLQTIFEENWQRATGERLKLRVEARPRLKGHGEFEENDRVVLVPGKPGIHDAVISEALFAAMSEARQSIYATTPYFIPDPTIAASLRVAARSGIDVKLIIPGISDSRLVLLATLSHIQDMLEAGVQVYRYGKGFIHAKVMIIDGKLASIGSANLDMRSLYTNYELLAFIEGEKPVCQLTNDFLVDLKDSVPMEIGEFSSRSAKQKAAESLMHLLSPLL
jgi:cardiolipin synthase